VSTIDPKELTDLDAVGVTIWWLGNAGFAINAAGRLILIDPVIEPKDDRDPVTSEIGLPLLVPLPIRARSIDRADLVLLTHDDGDHTAPRTVPELIARTRALFVGTQRTADTLAKYGLAPERMRVVQYGHPLRAADVTVTATVANHEEAKGHTQRGDCCGFIIEAAGMTIWHPGDSSLLDEHLTVSGIDVLLLPIAPHVFGTEGGIRLANSTRARHVIPCHYGTYDSDLYWCVGDPEAVREGVEDADRRYHQLAIGEKLVIPTP
jgi:L-ascorbate metabolism protein UlaG (beta-lactamase superfamily)